MQHLPLRTVAVILALALMTACTPTRDQFTWGRYEELVYQSYHKPEAALPAVQIEKLSIDIENAQREHKIIAPGIYAHLGYMHYLNQNPIQAKAAFETEIAMYPESKVFVERLLRALEAQEQQ